MDELTITQWIKLFRFSLTKQVYIPEKTGLVSAHENFEQVLNEVRFEDSFVISHKLLSRCCFVKNSLRGYSAPGPYFLKILNIFSKNRATLDKVSYGYGQRRSKELKNHSLTSAETIVVKLQ